MTSPPLTPSGLPLVGHIAGFAADPFGFIADLLADHDAEDAVGLDMVGMDELYILAHPDHSERAFVTDCDSIVKGDEFETAFGDAIIAAEGDEWRRQCDELNPFLRWNRIDNYASVMRRQVEHRLRTWPDAGTLSPESEMETITLDIIFATILGRKLDRDGDERVRSAADGLSGRFAPASWMLPSWVPTPSRRRFDHTDRVLHEEVRELVRTIDGKSLMRRLADAPGTDADYPTTVGSLGNQPVGMVFAGHETTALAFTYALYLLAAHPETRERATAEADRVVGDSPVTAEATRELPVLERVIKEAIRLYPPVHTLPRETAKPFPTGDRVIPASTDTHLLIIRIHRDERWCDDPLAFRPERWDDNTDRPAYAYLPFGAGPRSCLGRALALTEAKIVLTTVPRDFDLDWGDNGALAITPEMTTQPKGETPLVVRRQ